MKYLDYEMIISETWEEEFGSSWWSRNWKCVGGSVLAAAAIILSEGTATPVLLAAGTTGGSAFLFCWD